MRQDKVRRRRRARRDEALTWRTCAAQRLLWPREWKVPRVLVCAPSNKAVTVALREYLGRDAIGWHGRYPVLVGAEDALALVCGEGRRGRRRNVEGDGTIRLPQDVRPGVAHLARGEGAGAANTASARALSSVVRAVIAELEYNGAEVFHARLRILQSRWSGTFTTSRTLAIAKARKRRKA